MHINFAALSQLQAFQYHKISLKSQVLYHRTGHWTPSTLPLSLLNSSQLRTTISVVTQIKTLVLFPANKPALQISSEVLYHQTGFYQLFLWPRSTQASFVLQSLSVHISILWFCSHQTNQLHKISHKSALRSCTIKQAIYQLFLWPRSTQASFVLQYLSVQISTLWFFSQQTNQLHKSALRSCTIKQAIQFNQIFLLSSSQQASFALQSSLRPCSSNHAVQLSLALSMTSQPCTTILCYHTHQFFCFVSSKQTSSHNINTLACLGFGTTISLNMTMWLDWIYFLITVWVQTFT